MRHFPAIRTRPLPDWSTAFAFCAKSGVGMMVIALVLGVGCFAVGALTLLLADNYRLASKFQGACIIFVFSPVLTVPILICSAPVVALAARKGYAGWLVACALGPVAAIIGLWALNGFIWEPVIAQLGPMTGIVFAALFWVSAKLFYTDMLVSA